MAKLLWRDLIAVIAQAALRSMDTPGGLPMSVAMRNCGKLGCVSERGGLRCAAVDLLSARPWPAMPAPFRTLHTQVADQAGFTVFEPDSCLINRYAAGACLSLLHDRDEHDLSQPIVSISLGLAAVFLLDGSRRNEPAPRVPLEHGDVVAWAARRACVTKACCSWPSDATRRRACTGST